MLGLRKAEMGCERGGEGSIEDQDEDQHYQCALLTLGPSTSIAWHVVTWVGTSYVFLMSRRAGSQVTGSPSSQESTVSSCKEMASRKLPLTSLVTPHSPSSQWLCLGGVAFLCAVLLSGPSAATVMCRCLVSPSHACT